MRNDIQKKELGKYKLRRGLKYNPIPGVVCVIDASTREILKILAETKTMRQAKIQANILNKNKIYSKKGAIVTAVRMRSVKNMITM